MPATHVPAANVPAAKEGTAAYDVLVVGGDAAALVAALDCARIGLRVVVFATAPPQHQPVVFSHRDGIVASLLTELAVPFVVRGSVASTADGVNDRQDLSEVSIVGIPSNPFSARVRALLGWRGAWRIYRDRVTPLLTIGTQVNLGALVSRRLGVAAVQTLVAPALQELYGLTPATTDVAAVIPGLNQAMTRAGSLTTGILELAMADPRVAQLLEVEGGLHTVETALRERLGFFDARIFDITDAHLTVLEPIAPDVPSAFAASAATGDDTISVTARAVLAHPLAVTIPVTITEGSPEGRGASEALCAVVGIWADQPGLESAAPASREASSGIRRVLLSNPHRLPLGPGHLEG